MTREERDNALKVLKNYDLNFHKINGMLFSAEEIANAFDMAIEALEQEPTTKNDLGVDCISRKQALRELKESAEHHANNSREEVLLRRDRDIIRALPPVTPQEPFINKSCVSEKACEHDKNVVLGKIRAEIESNMESIIGKYDSSIPKSNMPSYKIERNKVRKECISIIDKYKAEVEPQESEDNE